MGPTIDVIGVKSSDRGKSQGLRGMVVPAANQRRRLAEERFRREARTAIPTRSGLSKRSSASA
jgi:hypothetical protein